MSERLDTVVAEVPASSGGSPAALPRIALLYADEALLPHVEQALAALRVPVVYRAAVAKADSAALMGAHPEVALINLDDRCGEELDALTAALDAAGVPIVFNDADISNGLEGWARARWARHLIAKLCGKDDVDPPRPVQAEVQAPAQASVVAEAPAVSPPEVPAEPEAVDQPPPVVESASASRPLSQGEIDSLLADFPSEATIGGEDTEAWSAHIDTLLANAPDSASREPAPWEVLGFEDETAPNAAPTPAPAATKAKAPGRAPAALAPVAPPSIDQWKLVDDFTPAAPAKPAAPAALPTNFGSGLALELEPLDPRESGQ